MVTPGDGIPKPRSLKKFQIRLKMQSNFLQAIQMAEKSRQERFQKIANLLAELPDDFDWSELEDQLKQN